MLFRRSRIALLFVLVAVLLVAVLLHLVSPWQQPGPIIRLLVGPEQGTAAAFDSRALTCDERDVQGSVGDQLRIRAYCTLLLHDDVLTVRVRYDGFTGNCAATYAGAALPCKTHIALYNAPLPSVFVQADLGLTPNELQALPGTNSLFYISEQQWVQIILVTTALIVGIGLLLVLGTAVLRQPKAFITKLVYIIGYGAASLALFAVVYVALVAALLTSGLVD